MVRMTPEVPRRETPRREFRFAMPWRYQQHQPVDLASFDALEMLRDLPMDRCGLIASVSVLSERYQAYLGRPPPLFRLQALTEREQ